MTKWIKGYKETKNVIHNEIGVSKEDILDVFEKVAQDEFNKMIANQDLTKMINYALNNVIENQIIKAIKKEGYPEITRNINYYTKKTDFNDYFSSYLKDKIEKMISEKFEVNFEIKMKQGGI